MALTKKQLKKVKKDVWGMKNNPKVKKVPTVAEQSAKEAKQKKK
jgi:hypothetical protein